MNYRLWFAAVAALSSLAGSCWAAEPTLTPQAAMVSLAGNWTGALEYRDYQSGEWYSLPESKTIAVLEDGVTLLEMAKFDDGPKTGTVIITSISAFEPDGVTLASASFRKGKAMSSDLETAHFSGTPSPSSWTLLFEADAQDDDRPAHLRQTMTCTVDTCTTLKEVDFMDDREETWIARNRSTMKRVLP